MRERRRTFFCASFGAGLDIWDLSGISRLPGDITLSYPITTVWDAFAFWDITCPPEFCD